MTRLLLIQILLLATPFILFVIYRLFVASRRRALGRNINETPYQFLLFIGAASALGALGYLALTSTEATHRDEVYVPARFENGMRHPAEWISREEAVERGLIRAEPAISRDVVRDRLNPVVPPERQPREAATAVETPPDEAPDDGAGHEESPSSDEDGSAEDGSNEDGRP